jgi:predicted alpha/beta superfamily hydrolase
MRSLLTLFFLTLLCTCVRAQTPITFGQSYQLHSEVLEEDRVLNVLLPAEYEDSTANNYPVIYLLDGATNEDFFHVSGLLRYFNDHHMMPPTILVGIANVDRKRDFTYPSKDPRDSRDFPTTGGSAKFIEFLQQELPVFVNKTFRTTDHRTLVGQSLGGLLATEILLKHPGHFNDYIIVSPSLWWDKEWMYTNMDSLVTALDVYPERLFVSVGVEYPVMVDGSRRLARLMKPHTKSTFLPLMDEDHNTILHEALYRAFDGWYDPTVLRPYQFANAWNGLNMRSGPSLDSAIVGKLDYGASLGVISQQEDEVVIDGLAGRWTYIGSDNGRGWVIDAYVSPVRVFDRPISLEGYAIEELGLSEMVRLYDYDGNKAGHSLKVYGTEEESKYIEHYYYEDDKNELQIQQLTKSQALVTTRNFLQANGWPNSLKAIAVWSGIFEFRHDLPENNDGETYEFMFSKGVLSMRHKGWFVRGMD